MLNAISFVGVERRIFEILILWPPLFVNEFAVIVSSSLSAKLPSSIKFKSEFRMRFPRFVF